LVAAGLPPLNINTATTATHTATESSGAGRKPKADNLPAKYRDPANPENTWSGRGLKPRWISALLEQGHAIDEFLIRD
jgi:DNA-binding protein H-NS